MNLMFAIIAFRDLGWYSYYGCYYCYKIDLFGIRLLLLDT